MESEKDIYLKLHQVMQTVVKEQGLCLTAEEEKILFIMIVKGFVEGLEYSKSIYDPILKEFMK